MRQLKITKSITNRESASLDKYLQEIGREDLITVEEEVELAQRIRKGDRVALEKLTRANLRFVVSVAKQYQNQGLSLPDLINEGNLGLIKAAEKFDETRGFKFISYAVWWIRQSILQALAEQSRIVRLPLNQVGSLNKISKAFSKFEQENERRPSPEELADELEIPVDKISETNKDGKKLRMAYLPQQIASFNAGFPSTVYEFVKSGRYPRQGWFRRLTKHDLEHVQRALESVGMWENRHKQIGRLSGGQKQRAVIARIFASDPDIFVLDEPTTGMDAGTANTFYELMHHSAHKHGKSVLMVTHDPEEVKEYTDRNIHLVRNQKLPWRCFNVHEKDGEEHKHD